MSWLTNHLLWRQLTINYEFSSSVLHLKSNLVFMLLTLILTVLLRSESLFLYHSLVNQRSYLMQMSAQIYAYQCTASSLLENSRYVLFHSIFFHRAWFCISSFVLCPQNECFLFYSLFSGALYKDSWAKYLRQCNK